MSSVKNEQASLFAIIIPLKYKFILYLLKEDRRKLIGFSI